MAAHAELGYVCVHPNQVSWGTSPCPSNSREERVDVRDMEAYARGLLAQGAASAPTAEANEAARRQQACNCKAAMAEVILPTTTQQRLFDLNKWIFENCRLKNVSPETCGR